jgi:hypothetical protein
MVNELNEKVIELIQARKRIEYEYAKPVMQRPLPKTEQALRVEVRHVISEYLTDEELANMKADKEQAYRTIHRRHMGFYEHE